MMATCSPIWRAGSADVPIGLFSCVVRSASKGVWLWANQVSIRKMA